MILFTLLIFVCYAVGSSGMNIIIVHGHFTVPTIRFELLCDLVLVWE